MRKVLLFICSSFPAIISLAQPGTLDTTFNHTGKVITTLPDSGIIRALAIQADGKIIAAGSKYNGSMHNFALIRYNTAGTLDSSFGINGIVITAINNADDINAVILQKDEKIIVAGSSYNGSIHAFALARYNNDGSLDASFGKAHTGIDTNSFGGFNSEAYDWRCKRMQRLLSGVKVVMPK